MVITNKKFQLLDGQYVKDETVKTKICIHHTVGGTAKSTIDYWNSDSPKVGTSYVIDRDGTIYETFDSKYWAYGLGLSVKECITDSGYEIPVTKIEKSTIGIELASEGGLYFKDNKLFNFKIGNPYKGKQYIKLSKEWRGFQYFDEYEPEMINSLYLLITDLIRKHPSIRPNVLAVYDTVNVKFFETYSGVFGHYHIRKDKTDPHLQFSWEKLSEQCKLIKTNQFGQIIVDSDKLKPASIQSIKIKSGLQF